MTQPAIVQYGPYGDRWAWRVANMTQWNGWSTADSAEECIAEAKEKVEKMGTVFGVHAEGMDIQEVEVPLYYPRTGGDEDEKGYSTDGVYEADGVRVPFSGACPVQGEGSVDGHACYYRARGAGWSMTIDLDGHTSWNYASGQYCAWPLAGWLHREESFKNIAKAVRAFREAMAKNRHALRPALAGKRSAGP